MTFWDSVKFLVIGAVTYFTGWLMGWRARGKEEKL